MIESYGYSDVGPVRSNNEDCFLSDDELMLFVVADGMGGHAAGEVASHLAVETIKDFVWRSRQPEGITWPCGFDPSLSFMGNRLKAAIYLANSRVFQAAAGRDDLNGMGTTVVCALVHGAHLTIGHVGDSRLYAFVDGTLSALTQDDTWAATVLAGADIDPRQLEDHPMRNVLTNVIGSRDQAEIHLAERGLTDGERLLLCSDGVHNVLDGETLRELLSQEVSLRAIAQSVVNAAIDRGTRDNATAVIVRYMEDDASA
jgi:protein phosphatase